MTIMLRKSKSFKLALFSLALLIGCSSIKPGSELKSCGYQFRSLVATGLDENNSYWNLQMLMYNPNSRPVTLNKLRFAIMNDNDTLLKGFNTLEKVVAANDSIVIQTTLDFSHTVFKHLSPELLANTNASFDLGADAYVNTWMGEIMVPGIFRQSFHVNVPEQLERYRNVLMQKHLLPPPQ